MSSPQLAPLELVVSRCSGSYSYGTSSEHHHSASGSDVPLAGQTFVHNTNSSSSGVRPRHSRRPSSPYLNPTRGPNASDPDFYLGDIYARISRPHDCVLMTQAEKDLETPSPYHTRIRDISRGWPHLRYLSDFMTVSTVPLRSKDLLRGERQDRLNRVDIAVVEHGDELSTKHLKDPEQLDDFLDSLKEDTEAKKPRLLVVSDLSTLVIEKLGLAFDIEPGFFRSHIGDYVWLNTRDPQAEIPDLEAFSRQSNYFSMQYVSPRYFENEEQLEKAKKQAEGFNVLRHVDHDGRFKSWSDKKGSDVGLVRCKMSFWVRPERGLEEGWLGIMIIDPPITHGFPLWSGYGNFCPPPSIHAPVIDDMFPPYGSLIKEFLFWTLSTRRSSPEMLPTAFFTIICAQWLIMCEYVNTRLGQIEYEIELGLSNLYAQDYDHTVKTLLMWRRRMPIYHTFVERSISRIEVRYGSRNNHHPANAYANTEKGKRNAWGDILLNLHDVLHRLEILHCRADKIMAVSMAVTAREESKKATQESHAITRVTYLAFIFVPLSFWTSFFSMSADLPIRTYWIFGAIAVPISAVALGALMFAGRIGEWWRGDREGRIERDGRGNEKWKGEVKGFSGGDWGV